MLLLNLLLTTTLLSPTATQSSNLDLIAQNVKKRLQDLVSTRTELLKTTPQTAYIGSLKDLNANILTISHSSQNLLASASAHTSFLRIPGNTKITISDLVLEEKVAAIGEVGTDKVLNAHQVIVQSTAPKDSLVKSMLGTVISYDEKKFVLTLQPVRGDQPIIVDLPKNAKIFTIDNNGFKTPLARNQSITPMNKCLLLYESPPPDSDIQAQELLITNQ